MKEGLLKVLIKEIVNNMLEEAYTKIRSLEMEIK